jgi:hypothetical protein
MAPSYLRVGAIVFYLVGYAEAYTKFDPTCSLPDKTVNFVSSADSRGTLDILWSSLFTIIACTWTIQHPNVPEQREDRDPGWVGTIKWSLRRFLRSTKWMILTIIAPEIIMGLACWDFVLARQYHKTLKDYAAEDKVPWTWTHTYFANMGAFAIRTGVSKEPLATPYIPRENTDTGDTLGEVQADRNPNQGETGEESQKPRPSITPEDDGNHNPFHLTASQICKLRELKVLPTLPYITKEEINDKSNSSPPLKTIALGQITWAMVQIIVRGARRIAISQLEIAVIAFASCAVFIYILYWPKPKDISTVTTILRYEGTIPPETLKEIDFPFNSFGKDMFKMFDSTAELRFGARIKNDAMERFKDDSESWLEYLAMVFGATVFGGIHVAAWNFVFPSRVELIFWRCTSVFSAAFGLVVIVAGLLQASSRFADTLRLISVVTVLYIICRLFLLVEILRTLCFLPPDAYISTWTSSIPHVG